eukprot:TRINITY_DN8097_c0_g1_i1.p1 TRINITY_DN8097_c0_g1~~TRINITY_DN8097_c0_g1_i1.p1  ORF type:complete len:305 (-),score=78.57 TRINITY_DN8097_c0_g1_i1:148-1062(-)
MATDSSSTPPSEIHPTLSNVKTVEIDPERTYRIYADGVFDLFHFGHARMLEQCKKLVPKCYLLVGLVNDELTHANKGITVMTDKERAESLRHCKWVDEVIEDAPWVITEEFVEKHQIDFVAHDPEPYPSADGSCADIYGWLKEGGKFMPTRRTDGISTTDLVIRIVRNYDDYVFRNLSRGVSREQMNVGFLHEKSLLAQMKIEELKGKGKDVKKTAQSIIEVGRKALRDEMDGVASMIDFQRLKRHLFPEFMKLFGARNIDARHFEIDEESHDSDSHSSVGSPGPSSKEVSTPKRARTQESSSS